MWRFIQGVVSGKWARYRSDDFGGEFSLKNVGILE